MRIAKVIGKVTLSRSVPEFQGAVLKLAVPMMLSDIDNDHTPLDDLLVVYDELGAGNDTYIAMSEGGEAAQPFYPDNKPVDAYNAAILDTVDIRYRHTK
ncbi:EutN/CcmL family microcompartment protein [Blastopirellula marina]|uniref:Carbon dioxide concentrating mechanism protein CcmL n=1 Tax=Blastopirellula marina TaxID=124 RepID=A0A2S8GCH8_9BACT|nr:EutN/CcmL family microcompartment protein [Blastopirellula marina]PQO42172.1 carbon dioxide concentrating mechanism protein CcmL [Blastopirellula marina]